MAPEEAKVGPGAQVFNGCSLCVAYIKCVLCKHLVLNNAGRTVNVQSALHYAEKVNIKPAHRQQWLKF